MTQKCFHGNACNCRIVHLVIPDVFQKLEVNSRSKMYNIRVNKQMSDMPLSSLFVYTLWLLSVPFLAPLLTDAVSKHIHLTLSPMFQATIASCTAAAGEASPEPDVKLGTPGSWSTLTPETRTGRLSTIFYYRYLNSLPSQWMSLVGTYLRR